MTTPRRRTEAPLRVLHLVQQSQARGAEIFAFDLAVESRRRGLIVRTVYLYESAATPLPEQAGEVRLNARLNHPLEQVPGFQPLLLRTLISLVHDFEPDIVQANGARTLKYGALLKRSCRRAPFTLIYRSIGDPLVWVRGRVKRWIFRRLFIPAVDGIAAVSSGSLEGLQQLYDLDEKVVEQIPRGIDPQRLAPQRSRADVRAELGAAASDPVLIFVGSLSPEKRPDRLARIFATVATKRADSWLWVLGDGAERERFEAKLRQLGVQDRVRLLGSQGDVGSYMAAADTLVLTSDTEGLPGVILEAGHVGLAAVSTDVGGVGDAIVDRITGRLIPPEDEAGFVDAIHELLLDPHHHRSVVTAAKTLFDTVYDISAVADRYAKLYGAAQGHSAP